MTIAAAPGDGGDPSQLAYEALRGFAVAGAASGGFGLVVLLREGLAAWLARRGIDADAVKIAPPPVRRAGWTLASQEVHIGLVHVLASMVLGNNDKEANA